MTQQQLDEIEQQVEAAIERTRKAYEIVNGIKAKHPPGWKGVGVCPNCQKPLHVALANHPNKHARVMCETIHCVSFME